MLETDINSALLENKAKRDAARQTTENVSAAPASSTTTQIQQPSSSEPVPSTIQPIVKAVPPTPEKPVEPAKPETTTKNPDDTITQTTDVIEDEYKWDANIPDPKASPNTENTLKTSEFDFKKLGSALSLEVTNEEELVAKVNERFTKLKALEPLALDGLSDAESLKQVIEIAKKGGDWKSYMNASALDATALDPIHLFEREYERANAPRFTDASGNVNLELLDQELESIAPGIKSMEGNRLKNAIIAQQEQKKSAVLAQTMAQQEKFQKSLGEAARELASIIPQEKFGIKIEPKHASYFYEGIANGSLVKKHLGDIDPSVLAKIDGKKLMKTLAIAELGESISQFQFKQGETAGKKKLLSTTQNVNLDTPSSLPRPTEQVETKQSSVDLFKERQAQIKPKNSL
jgi:hypothetical protein